MIIVYNFIGLNIAGGAGVYFATKHGVSAFTKSEAVCTIYLIIAFLRDAFKIGKITMSTPRMHLAVFFTSQLYLSELSPDCGVRVCCLCPPYVKTDLINFYKPEKLNQESSQVVLFNKYGGWNE